LGGEGNERSTPYNYLPIWQRRLMRLDFHNPAESMEVASDCNSSFSPHHCSFDVVSWVNHSGGRGGGFVPGLSPRLLSFLIHERQQRRNSVGRIL
jgi:hypothetical protein